MTSTLYSFTDAGEHNGTKYDLFVRGYQDGPFELDSIRIDGRGTSNGTKVQWDTVASAMASGHQLAKKLIDEAE